MINKTREGEGVDDIDNIKMAIMAVAPLSESMWANSNLGYDWFPFYLLTSHRPILRPRFRTMRRRPSPPLPSRLRVGIPAVGS